MIVKDFESELPQFPNWSEVPRSCLVPELKWTARDLEAFPLKAAVYLNYTHAF